MTVPAPSDRQLAPFSASTVDLTFRDGSELAAVTEALYLRLFVIALGGLQLVCGLAILAAVVRTENANLARTAVLALAVALLAALTLRAPVPVYRAIRRRPALSLTAPVIALGALAIDGVGHSPLSYVAAVSIAFPAFVCGRRWALAAATLITVGAIGAATLRTGSSALNSVGQGAVGYFVWALVLAGLAESFVQLTMRAPPNVSPPATVAPPVRVQNLAGDQQPTPEPDNPSPLAAGAPEQPDSGRRMTARQLQVVVLLADGLQAEDIAQRLSITTSMVYRHVQQAKERAGVGSRSELVALAIRDGLVSRRP